MPFVLDASVTMSWCFADEITPYSNSVLQSLRETHAEVPPLWFYEIVNVLAVSERKGRVNPALSDEFMRTLTELDIRVEQSTPQDSHIDLLQLARRYGLTAYDAAYLELAKRRNLPLATFDKNLATAARQENIELLKQQP